MSYQQDIIKEVANTLVGFGFTVYLSKSKTHGFYTNKQGSRVISFQTDLGVIKFSGNYKPSRESGTGWGMEYKTSPLTLKVATDMLAANAPSWTRNYNPQYTTAAQHLETYGASSGYELYQAEEVPNVQTI